MLSKTIMRVPRLLGRRKIETVVLALVAAATAVGLSRNDSDRAPLASVAAAVRHPATRVVASFDGELAEAAKPTTRSASAARGTDLRAVSHPLVNSWIKQFTTAQRAGFAISLKRMTKYEELITTKLAQRKMPTSLIYLAMIESGFNASARSPVKALGLWQFMSGTAKQYGLKVTGKVDERKNPARATDAALAYLSDLYDRFGSWYLAAAAYNSGPATISKAMKKVTGRTKGSDADFFRIAHKLPKETREYVPKLLAAAKIGQNPERYGFSAD